jgi:hypothetical protein|tara:strand:- start:93 stop:518 length:426 start_codon:yes stop_codon:yes gene_type:complete
MIKIYSKCEPGKLLHLINRFDEIDGRTDIAPEEQFIQAATIKFPQGGKKFRTHQHIWKPAPREQVIAQESWIVVQGSVRVFMYDTDQLFLQDEVIKKGDCSMTFEGGHTYEILEDDTIVYEYKTGPYMGVENDKIFYDEQG